MDEEINISDYHEDLSMQQMERHYIDIDKANQELIQEYLESIEFFYE